MCAWGMSNQEQCSPGDISVTFFALLGFGVSPILEKIPVQSTST